MRTLFSRAAYARGVSKPAPTSRLHFRLPGRVESLGSWLAALLPRLDRGERRGLVEGDRVQVDGRGATSTNQVCPAGAKIEIELVGSAVAALGVDAAAELGLAEHWFAWVEEAPWASGELKLTGRSPLNFDVVERWDSLARIEVQGEAVAAQALCLALAEIDLPVVGDLANGGLGVPGGVRVAPAGAALPKPEEIVWQWDHGASASSDDPTGGTFVVSDETARVLAGGHCWILPDDASDSAGNYRRGALVRVTDRERRGIAWAHIEGTPRLSARVWGHGDRPLRALESIDARISQALGRRSALLWRGHEPTGSNAFRLVHGEADGFPGLYIDRLGSLLRVLVSGWATEGFRDRTIEALLAQLPMTPEGLPWSVLELLHLRSPAGRAVDRVRWRAGGLEELAKNHPDLESDRFVVRERGLRFEIDPGWDAPRKPRPGYGLFVDQRENRERVAKLAARGGRWLNLFAHTGAFSVALLAAGAEQVISVDLSGAYLERTDRNVALNQDLGVDPSKHKSVRGDVRRFLESLDSNERFDGMVIDPPTAAAAGRRFWSVKDDLEPLLQLALDRLAPGGSLLVTQNRSGPPVGIGQALERVAARACIQIYSIDPALAGVDHPSLPGFPEGEAFEGWLLRIR